MSDIRVLPDPFKYDVLFSVDVVAAVREVSVQRVGVLQERCSSQPKKPMNPYSRQYNRDHRDHRDNNKDSRDSKDNRDNRVIWIICIV